LPNDKEGRLDALRFQDVQHTTCVRRQRTVVERSSDRNAALTAHRISCRNATAKILKTLDEQEIAAKSSGTCLYQRLAKRCLASLTEVEPLSRADAVRLELRHRGAGAV
jgi:hypothetical protein